MNSRLIIKKTLPATLRALLAYQNRSVLSVAADMGTSPHWWYRRLNGHTPITVGDLLLIADALGVDPVVLLASVLSAVPTKDQSRDEALVRVRKILGKGAFDIHVSERHD